MSAYRANLRRSLVVQSSTIAIAVLTACHGAHSVPHAAAENPLVGALKAVDYCTKGCAHVGLVDTLVREARRSPTENPERLPVAERLSMRELVAGSRPEVHLVPATRTDLTRELLGPDTVRLAIERVSSRPDTLLYGIGVTGRRFPHNYVVLIVFTKQRERWVAGPPSYPVE